MSSHSPTAFDVATFNVCNFGLDSHPDRVRRLGATIATQLGGPALVGLQEIKGDTLADSGPVMATASLARLVDAIETAGGPRYQAVEVPPIAGCDGGQAGANIRVALLADPARVQLSCELPGGPLEGVGVRRSIGETRLTRSPARIEPHHPAFEGCDENHWQPSRKALAVDCRIHNRSVTVVVCHLKSMRALLRREEDYAKKQRHAQAEVINGFVNALLTVDPGRAIVVLGDMNDVIGSKTLKLLKGLQLHNLVDDMPRKQAYSRRHGGRPQALDHVLISAGLRALAVNIPHVNSDAPQELRGSDHDPVHAWLDLV